MSTPGIEATTVDGTKVEQAKCDQLHFLKNRPDPPMIDGLPIEFPPYAYRPYPAAMYGPWSDDAKRNALIATARAYGLDLMKPLEREAAESKLAEYDTKLVGNDRERADWLAKGWADGPDLVKAAQKAYYDRIADQAAERAFDDQQMGAKARAEFDAADRANGDEHLLDLPVPPADKKKRGRPAKQTAPVNPAA